jgi:inorganic pyrophosphatase
MSAEVGDPAGFWSCLQRLVDGSRLVIDRPKGSRHPRFPELAYPLDYGFLEGTSAADRGGIDVWIGSRPERGLGGVICTVDLEKRDAELKVLLGCTEEEIRTVLDFHHGSIMRAMAITRPQEDT